MIIRVERIYKGTESTLSRLFIDGLLKGFVLEDQDRGLTSDMDLRLISMKKVHGRTCIPSGRYRVNMTFSNRFQKTTAELLGVPGFAGIRIHSGNYIGDTEGCLLPGERFDKDSNGYYRVWDSRVTVKVIEAAIRVAGEPVYCEVSRLYKI